MENRVEESECPQRVDFLELTGGFLTPDTWGSLNPGLRSCSKLSHTHDMWNDPDSHTTRWDAVSASCVSDCSCSLAGQHCVRSPGFKWKSAHARCRRDRSPKLPSFVKETVSPTCSVLLKQGSLWNPANSASCQFSACAQLTGCPSHTAAEAQPSPRTARSGGLSVPTSWDNASSLKLFSEGNSWVFSRVCESEG